MRPSQLCGRQHVVSLIGQSDTRTSHLVKLEWALDCSSVFRRCCISLFDEWIFQQSWEAFFFVTISPEIWRPLNTHVWIPNCYLHFRTGWFVCTNGIHTGTATRCSAAVQCSVYIIRQGRGSEATEATVLPTLVGKKSLFIMRPFLAFGEKKPLHNDAVFCL